MTGRFRKILAATDLSTCAGTAVSFAGEIARRTDGEVTVLHVDLGVPPHTSMALAGERTYRPASEQQQAAARRELDRHLSAHLLTGSRAVPLVVTGRPATEIFTVSNSLAADLIVIGTNGHGPLTRALLGSVAEEVIRETTRPVLSVRCRKRALKPQFRRIACAVNYTTASGEAFASAITLASVFDAKLVAVHVLERQSSNAEDELERLRAWLRNDTLGVQSTVLPRRRGPASALLDFAKRNEIDLLVIGAQRRRLGKRTPLGTTTSAITHRARCPVLTISVEGGDR